MSEEAEMSDDDKEEELYSPSAEVSDESGNGDATEQNQKFVSIFVGNLGETTGPPDIKELFESYGITVDHVDMKICFAFVHCLWVTNLQEIVTRMQGSLFRNSPKVPKIEISKGDGDVKKREERRNKIQAPSTTLFVIGFDPMRTTEDVILSTFSATAAVQRVLMRKNFCFIRFNSVEDATKVKDLFHGQDVWGRTLSIQFSSGNNIEMNGKRDQRQDDRGRKDDNDQNRGGKMWSDSGGYSDSRGDRDSDVMNPNRNGDGDNYGNSNPYDGKRGSGNDGNSYGQNDNYLRRMGRDDGYDRPGRNNGTDRDGGRGGGKSNFVNRSRSRDRGNDRDRDRDRERGSDRDRDRHNGTMANSNQYNDRPSDQNRNNRAFNNPKFDFPSISVISLPFPASGGRFIYEHVDGRREYVDAVFSSSFGNADRRRRSDSRERDADPPVDVHAYEELKEDRTGRRRSGSIVLGGTAHDRRADLNDLHLVIAGEREGREDTRESRYGDQTTPSQTLSQSLSQSKRNNRERASHSR